MHETERLSALGGNNGPADDSVWYEMYVDDQGLTETDLGGLRDQLLQRIETLTRGYIWQNDGLYLCVTQFHKRPSASRDGLQAVTETAPKWCLWGQTNFGDNIEDEWLVTWLLLQLTKENSSLSARAWDADGEFLLIEAAFALPSWLKPESAINRIWLRGGALHLVPRPSGAQAGAAAALTTAEALNALRSRLETLAPSQMQAAVAARLSGYPQQISRGVHRATAMLPKPLARVLQQDPSLIAPAVLAFHYRDAKEAEIGRQGQHFPPEELVETVVKFSRCLYAQLVTQQYDAAASWPLPLPSEADFPAARLGAKLSAGFEILMARASPNPTATSTAPEIGDVEASAAWPSFMQVLADRGFFGEERIGTPPHDALLSAAAEQFRRTDAFQAHVATARRPADRITALLAGGRDFNPALVEGPAESDAWMAEGADEVEQRLQQRQGETEADATAEADPTELVQRFEDFLKGEADFEGADVSDGPLPASGASGEAGVDLDEGGIWREVERILHFERGAGRAGSGSEGSSFYGEYSDDENMAEAGPSPSAPVLSSTAQPRTANSQAIAATRRGDDKMSSKETAAAPEEVMTETDSDDPDGGADYFEAAYEQALMAEMREADVMHPAQAPPTAKDGGELAPVDLDMNLVQNLIASYEAQEGLPGPVGNLFGMMGLHLPRQRDGAEGGG